MVVSYLGIGSNVGDRAAFCRASVAALQAHPDIEVERTSSLYETSPIGGPPQRSFVNMVVRIRTSLDARALLEAVKKIERQLGREPNEMRWGPRVADLDVLTYDDEKIVEPDLEIPHPRLTQRRFVLVPLLEIDPEASDPWGSRYADVVDEADGDVELLERF
ncbi:MAG TPA: 2-amino-4-hydroxy-6-hydroxymethyldihydropteridine diphosphokinase [Actinomycetota bacterium]|nr:2-amino-4-hydroxy-6-hydroxymethyldihydropteridine diphosphokinase [Actinomycetota bacterium]